MGNNDLNRRQVLRQVGAGISAGAAGLVASVSASHTSEHELDEILNTSQVRALLTETDHPSIKRDEIGTVVVEFAEGSILRSTSIPTEVGDILFAQYDDGEVADTLLLLTNDANNPYRKYLNQNNEGGDRNSPGTWPVGTNGFLTVEDDGVRFVRDAHPRELAEVARLLDTKPTTVEAIVDAKKGVYHVVRDDENGDSETLNSDTVSIVNLETKDVQKTEIPSSNPISIQHHNRDYCLYQFGACLWALALPPSCSYCGTLCRASRITGWAGYAACFVCISHICGIQFLWNASGCYSAAQCLEHWDVI